MLAAVVARAADDLVQVKLIDEIRERSNQDRAPKFHIPARKPIHFRDLKHEQRKFYAARLGRAELKNIVVKIHKPDRTSPEKFQADTRLSFNAEHPLVERITG